MESFEFVFLLNTMIENLNRDLQNSDLCVINSLKKVEAVADVLKISRELKFTTAWSKTLEDVERLDLEEPSLPRKRKIPKRFNPSNTENHHFENPEQMYRQIFFEIFDQMLKSLQEIFDSDSSKFCKLLECFVVGQDVDSDGSKIVDKIVEFYENDFVKDDLVRERDFFLNLAQRSSKEIKSLQDAVNFLRENDWSRNLVPEHVKFIR